MWTAGYLMQMREYYDNASHTAYAVEGGTFAEEYDAAYAEAGNGLRELMLVLENRMAGKNVLEAGCGHGRWTRYVARTARHVLATDNSPRMLAQAAELIHHRNPLPAGRVELREWDAMRIGELDERFDGAFHVNFFDHLPRSIQGAFLDGLHSRVESGSPVVMALNKLRDSTREGLYAKEGGEDRYMRRERPDGSVHEIICNEMGEEELTGLVGNRGRDFEFTRGKNLTWLAYTAA